MTRRSCKRAAALVWAAALATAAWQVPAQDGEAARRAAAASAAAAEQAAAAAQTTRTLPEHAPPPAAAPPAGASAAAGTQPSAPAATQPASDPSATGPATSPSTTPASTIPATTTTATTSAPTFLAAPPAPPMPPEFTAMLTRNVFMRGAPKPKGPTGPEGNFGFNGVVIDDGKYTAFVEDLSGKRTMRLKAGDAVAQGKVKSVTDDVLEYEAGGKVTRVQIGQNLLGAPLPPPPPPPPTAQPQPAQPPGGPPPPGAPGMPPGAVPGQPQGAVRVRR